MSDSIQYTIRNISPAADALLRSQAKKQGISLNKLVLQKLGAAPKTVKKPKIHHDLDWFFGSMTQQAADELDRVISEERHKDGIQAQAEFEAEKARGEWD